MDAQRWADVHKIGPTHDLLQNIFVELHKREFSNKQEVLFLHHLFNSACWLTWNASEVIYKYIKYTD
jgi:hypothetical protein